MNKDLLIERIKRDLIQVDPRVSRLQFYSSNKSYTINKKKIYLCCRDKDGTPYEYNFLIYVALHELSHAFSSSYDDSHKSSEFLSNFLELKKKAEKLKIWDPKKPLLKNYCNYKIK